ncbi:MAG: thioredoxin family protein [Chitinophagaceae bacterium]|nr:thioredoxin family protein [Chitinophagaceae bacterium]
MKQFFQIFVLLIILYPAQAQNRKVNLKENLPFKEVLSMAKQENKLIFLDFGSLTCTPCMYLKKMIFTVDSVADFINERFVSVDYNVGAEKKRLSDLYGVDSEPVLLILDQQGNLLHRMVGKCDGDELLKRFRQGLDPVNNLSAQEKRYAKGDREPEFLLAYLETLRIAKYTDKMNNLIKSVLAGPLEQLKEKPYWELFVKYNDDPVSREMLYVFDNREEFYKLFGKGIVENKIDRHFSAKASFYIYGHKPPAKDSAFYKMLNYLRKTDYPKASEWLAYLTPAEYKFTNWENMAKAIDNAISFNILKGKQREMYLKMMAEQILWYSTNKTALPYALKWIDTLMPELTNQDTIKSVADTRKKIKQKLDNKG